MPLNYSSFLSRDGIIRGSWIATLWAGMKSTAMGHVDFEAILVSEVEALREGEEHLRRLYRQLRKKPHLRDSFLNKLSEVAQRAERLHAVLNPCEAFQIPTVELSAPQIRPAA